MTQNEKDLLLKDLCARLPYGVKLHCSSNVMICIGPYTLNTIVLDRIFNDNTEYVPFDEFKPYLFPLSSMTEEQYYEMQTISGKDCLEHMEVEKEWKNNSSFSHLPLYEHRVIDFFDKNHFDYRGLIPMGLAIDATGKNIY